MSDRFRWGFLAGVLVSGLGVWGYSFLHTTAEEARMLHCAAVLKHVGMALADYREQHAGRCPARFDELRVPEDGALPCRCPSAKHLGKRAYLYLPPREGASDETPVLFCWRHPKLLIVTKAGYGRRLGRSDGPDHLPRGPHPLDSSPAVETAATRAQSRPAPTPSAKTEFASFQP